MTIGELITLLRTYPPETRVFVPVYEINFDELRTEGIEEGWFKEADYCDTYIGPYDHLDEEEPGAIRGLILAESYEEDFHVDKIGVRSNG